MQMIDETKVMIPTMPPVGETATRFASGERRSEVLRRANSP
jgi:hypothetical protein